MNIKSRTITRNNKFSGPEHSGVNQARAGGVSTHIVRDTLNYHSGKRCEIVAGNIAYIYIYLYMEFN